MKPAIQLAGITWDHPRGYDCLVAASQEYLANFNIEVSWKARSLQAFADEPIDQLAEQYDLIVLDHPHVGQVAQNQCLSPLPEPKNIAESSMGGSIESYYYAGQYWAYGIDAACQMAVHRPDLNHTLPKHWEDFLQDNAKQFSAITPLKPVDAFDAWLTLAASLGEQIPHSPNNFIAEDAALKGLEILKALYRLGPQEAVGWNPIKVLETLSITDEFAYSPCLFGYVNYVKPGFRQHRLQYLDIPTFQGSKLRRSILGGAGIGVSAQRKHLDAAIAYAQWIASEAVQSGVYLANEGQPVHRGTWLRKADDPELGAFFGGAMQTMANAWTRPREEWFLHFVDDVCEIFPAFFLQNQSSEYFLTQINALYQSHINKG